MNVTKPLATEEGAADKQSFLVAKWDLQDSDLTVPEMMSTIEGELEEKIYSVDNDKRKKVSPEDFAPYGKYRGMFLLVMLLSTLF